MRFSDAQLRRYARHIVLPEVGGKGQRRLLESSVLVVGAGGLGSPVLLYLAAAGVGTIHCIDDDVVSLDNLQRQIIHSTAEIGEKKTASARRAIERLNPGIQFAGHDERLTDSNAADRIDKVGLVLDGSDNFTTRFLVNDACWRAETPLISGSMFRFEGQVALFPMRHDPPTPCYRCLYPEPPPPGLVPSCQEAGIFGAVPGVIGSLMAAEAIKWLLQIGDPLAARLCLYDALDARFREVQLKVRDDCPLKRGDG